MTQFNPNDVGVSNGNYFGLPYSLEESEVVLISVPWDVTTSYSAGTSEGPAAIIDASIQIDLFDLNVSEAWKVKIGTAPIDKNIVKFNRDCRKRSEGIIEQLERGIEIDSLKDDLKEINEASVEINEYVYALTKKHIDQGRVVGVVGGEHSVPFGAIKAIAEKYGNIGILHIDAHADLREAYEGFTYSHASIMFNVLKEIPNVSKITQVAVRDFCNDEHNIMLSNKKVHSFTDADISDSLFEGESWMAICDNIIDSLPKNVYISFDIDGLDPSLCPNTGTPVPGGLSFRQADYLLNRVREKKRNIVGFDLCEVAPEENGEWNANVGARMLYKLSLYSKK